LTQFKYDCYMIILYESELYIVEWLELKSLFIEESNEKESQLWIWWETYQKGLNNNYKYE